MILFLTGGTGFLGRQLVHSLVGQFDKIYLLTRSTNNNIFNEYKNVILVEGDITSPDIINSSSMKEEIRKSVTHILHAAAYYDLKANHANLYLHNVVGTQNILNFSSSFKSLMAFYYISTIAVADPMSIVLYENFDFERTKFSDHYSKTKFIAEKLVQEHIFDKQTLVRVFRPGIIVGHSQTGEIDKVDGPYYFIKAINSYRHILKTLKFLPFPYSPKSKMAIIPVDHCARFISLLIKKDDDININASNKLEVFHLISDEIPTIQEFLDDLKLKYSLNCRFIPVPSNVVLNTLLPMFSIPKEVFPFMFSKISYDKANTLKKLPELKESKYSSYKEAILK